MQTRHDEGFHALSNQDFLNLGVNDVAYIKRVGSDGDGRFVVHGANGAEIASFESLGRAVGIIRQNKLHPVWVQ